MNRTKAVVVQQLVKEYPLPGKLGDLLRGRWSRSRVKALNRMELSLERGVCFCLLGPNGAGKTTLIKILSTLILPDDGRAEVFGFDVSKFSQEVKRLVSYVMSDERSFYWRLTGRQNLTFFGALCGLSSRKLENKIAEVLAVAGLEAVADLRVNTYSTGMRQMLALARALLSDPELLLIDEPTRSLDPITAQRIRSFIRNALIKGQGKTVLVATHNLQEAEEMADQLAIINRGQCLVQGDLAELTEKSWHSLASLYEKIVAPQQIDR